MASEHELLASELEKTGDYRILRRLKPKDDYSPRNGREVLIGVILDTETTGLEVECSEVIELGMVKFEYTAEGEVIRVIGAFNQLQQPRQPIPAEIVRITGITDEMVRGQAIHAADVAAFVAGAAVIIAHNAKFDLPICEKTWPLFNTMNWACSLNEILWKELGFKGAKLGYLLNELGLFHNGHRASDDCRALLHILASSVGLEAKPALGFLLAQARKATFRLWATNAPFDAKEILKARRYKWSDGTGGSQRAWWTEVTEDKLADELEYLRAQIYKRPTLNLPMSQMTAAERYSNRITDLELMTLKQILL